MDPNFNSYEKYISVVDRREIILHSVMRQQYKKEKYDNHKVSIVTTTNKTIYKNNIIENFLRQNYPNKELIIILNNNELNKDEWLRDIKNLKNIYIYQLDESVTLGECLNYAVDKSSGVFIAKFDDDDYYAPNYLKDLIYCFSYTDASIVGKASQFVYFIGSSQLIMLNYANGYNYYPVWGGTHVIKREVFEKVKFKPVNIAEDVYFNDECDKLGIKQYVADPFNYLRIRVKDKKYHTYKIADNEYIKSGKLVSGINDPWSYITI